MNAPIDHYFQKVSEGVSRV